MEFTGKIKLKNLIQKNSFQYSKEPKFQLVSNAISNFYFDMKKTTMTPEGMFLVGKIVFEKIKEIGIKIKGIGGLTMGADPIAYAVARYSYDMQEPIEAFIARKEPKQHGLKLSIEGNIKSNDTVVIVDDVITTGGSTIKAIELSKEYGLKIEFVIVLVDRCEQNGRQNIEALGYSVYPIFSVNDFLICSQG